MQSLPHGCTYPYLLGFVTLWVPESLAVESCAPIAPLGVEPSYTLRQHNYGVSSEAANLANPGIRQVGLDDVTHGCEWNRERNCCRAEGHPFR